MAGDSFRVALFLCLPPSTSPGARACRSNANNVLRSSGSDMGTDTKREIKAGEEARVSSKELMADGPFWEASAPLLRKGPG